MTATTATATLRVEVWADVLCPFCYIAEHRLSEAIRISERPGRAIEVRVRTFELDPGAPAGPVPAMQALGRQHGWSEQDAHRADAGVARLARAEGLPYSADRLMRGTGDLLRVVHLAAEHGVALPMLTGLQTAAFGGDPDALEPGRVAALGQRLGMDGDEVRDVLRRPERYADEVREDRAAAEALGAGGMPFVVVGGRLALAGAASTRQYADALERGWGLS